MGKPGDIEVLGFGSGSAIYQQLMGTMIFDQRDASRSRVFPCVFLTRWHTPTKICLDLARPFLMLTAGEDM